MGSCLRVGITSPGGDHVGSCLRVGITSPGGDHVGSCLRVGITSPGGDHVGSCLRVGIMSPGGDHVSGWGSRLRVGITSPGGDHVSGWRSRLLLPGGHTPLHCPPGCCSDPGRCILLPGGHTPLHCPPGCCSDSGRCILLPGGHTPLHCPPGCCSDPGSGPSSSGGGQYAAGFSPQLPYPMYPLPMEASLPSWGEGATSILPVTKWLGKQHTPSAVSGTWSDDHAWGENKGDGKKWENKDKPRGRRKRWKGKVILY